MIILFPGVIRCFGPIRSSKRRSNRWRTSWRIVSHNILQKYSLIYQVLPAVFALYYECFSRWSACSRLFSVYSKSRPPGREKRIGECRIWRTDPESLLFAAQFEISLLLFLLKINTLLCSSFEKHWNLAGNDTFAQFNRKQDSSYRAQVLPARSSVWCGRYRSFKPPPDSAFLFVYWINMIISA